MQHQTVFVDKNIFKYSKVLEDNWKNIYDEFSKQRDKIRANNILSHFHPTGGDEFFKDWTIYPLKSYNQSIDEMQKIFPYTSKLINDCTDITTAFFSILKPHKHIPPHKGPTKSILRYHLTLKTPKDNKNCYIIVGGEKYHWVEGEGILFDETFLHEVYNDTDEERVVLFIDVKRPMDTIIGELLRDMVINIIKHSPANKKSKMNF